MSHFWAASTLKRATSDTIQHTSRLPPSLFFPLHFNRRRLELSAYPRLPLRTARMSLPSPASTPATSPMPLHPTFASALIPPSPDPSHAPRGTSGTSRPLLPSRLSSVSGPSSSLIPPAAAKRIPSRYSGCQLCELVREARKVFGYSTSGGDGLPGSAGPSGSRRGSADGGGERDRGPDSAGPSTASSSSSFPSHTRPQGYAQPVQQASGGSSSSNASPIGQTINGREILYHDPDITVYPAAGAERLRSEGKHLVIVVNTHAESVYEFVSCSFPISPQ